MLPYVKINFKNGNLGSVQPSADKVVGVIAPAVAVADKFALNKPTVIYRPSSLDDLGITASNNALLFDFVNQFYSEAAEGSELWIYGVATSTQLAAMFASTGTGIGKKFVDETNGRLRLVCALTAASETVDITAVSTAAQALGVYATDSLFAPISCAFGVAGSQPSVDLTAMSKSRVSVLVGSDKSGGNAAVGIFAGKFAATDVQVSVARVKDGALSVDGAFIGSTAIDNDTATTLSNLGYITFRTFVGRSGYFLTDDNTADLPTSDFKSLANRRVIDKAYRTIYATLVDHVNEEIPVNSDGTMAASIAAAWEADVVSDIVNTMTINGNLGVDPDADDKGVIVNIDTDQNVVATNKVAVNAAVKPYGYAKYIEVSLGLTTKTV